MQITDEQARIIGREVGNSIAEMLRALLSHGRLSDSFGDRIVSAVREGCATGLRKP
jgi:hypothetical protein